MKGMDEAKFNAQFVDPFAADNKKPTFDPFVEDKDSLPTSNASKTTNDPFASPHSTSTTSNSTPNSNSNHSPKPTNDLFSDLFGPTSSQQPQSQPTGPSYDDKKKSIQQLLSMPPASTPGFGVMQPSQPLPNTVQPQYNFGTQPFYGQQQQQMQPIQQMQQPFYGQQQQQMQPIQQMQQPFGFVMTPQQQQQQTTSNPFASNPPPQQQQQNTNPFAF